MTHFIGGLVELQIKSGGSPRLIDPWHVLISFLLLGIHSLLFLRHNTISLIRIILERVKVITSANEHSSLKLVFWVVLRELNLLRNDYIMLLEPVPAAHIAILTKQWVVFIDSNDRCHIRRLSSISLLEKGNVILGSSMCLGLDWVQMGHASLWSKLEYLTLIKISCRGRSIILLLDYSCSHCWVQVFLIVWVFAFFHLTLILIICVINTSRWQSPIFLNIFEVFQVWYALAKLILRTTVLLKVVARPRLANLRYRLVYVVTLRIVIRWCGRGLGLLFFGTRQVLTHYD
jgi:hypothetical protein